MGDLVPGFIGVILHQLSIAVRNTKELDSHENLVISTQHPIITEIQALNWNSHFLMV